MRALIKNFIKKRHPIIDHPGLVLEIFQFEFQNIQNHLQNFIVGFEVFGGNLFLLKVEKNQVCKLLLRIHLTFVKWLIVHQVIINDAFKVSPFLSKLVNSSAKHYV